MLHSGLTDSADCISTRVDAQLHKGLRALFLICGLGVWLSWAVVSVLLLQLGFPYSLNALFSLIAIAGMAGGSLRIAFGFLSPALTSIWVFVLPMMLLIISSLGLALTLQRDTPLWVLQILALLSGLGGGFYSLFSQRVAASDFLRRGRPTIGWGTGFGQLTVAASQILLPWIVTFQLWPSPGLALVEGKESSTVLGAATGEWLWLANIGWVWSAPLIGLLCLMLIFSLWQKLGLVAHRAQWERQTGADRATGSTWAALNWALLIGLFVSVLGCWLTFPSDANGVGLQVSRELVLAAMVVILLALVRVFPSLRQSDANPAHGIFNNKHTWLMSALCSMTLGTFFGLAAALPLTLEWTFGYVSMLDGSRQPNPNAPRIFAYVWMAPLIGVLMRPVGGWMAARFGGARTTQYCGAVMVAAAAGAAFYFASAYRAPEPEQYFLPFFMLIFLLFAAAGAGYAAVLQTIERLFPASQLAHLNVWMAGIAAYGMFYIPGLLADQIQRGTPEQAMISFALFYALCLLLNGWFYLRRDGTFYNP